MARPIKQGLDYFPLDVDFFQDEKIVSITGKFGLKGQITVLHLLGAIYRVSGYFLRWDELTQAKLLAELPGISEQLLDDIVNYLVRWDFFDEVLFCSAKVLTSKGIQKRYFEAVKRRTVQSGLPYLIPERGSTQTNTTDIGRNDENTRTRNPDRDIYPGDCRPTVASGTRNEPLSVQHSEKTKVVNVDKNPGFCYRNHQVGENEDSQDACTAKGMSENRVYVYKNPLSEGINVNKNPLKESKDNNNQTTACVRAYEDESAGDAFGFYGMLMREQAFWETAAMSLHAPVDDLKKLLRDFELESQAKATNHATFREYRSHFFDWARINIQIKKRYDNTEASNKSGNAAKGSNAWAGAQCATKQDANRIALEQYAARRKEYLSGMGGEEPGIF